jgi:hypothetical protein
VNSSLERSRRQRIKYKDRIKSMSQKFSKYQTAGAESVAVGQGTGPCNQLHTMNCRCRKLGLVVLDQYLGSTTC